MMTKLWGIMLKRSLRPLLSESSQAFLKIVFFMTKNLTSGESSLLTFSK